jgi:hypothetical protein
VRSAVRVGPGPPSRRDGTATPPGVVGGQRVPGPPAPPGGRSRAAPRRRRRSLFTSCGGVVLAGLPDPLGPAEAGLTGGCRSRSGVARHPWHGYATRRPGGAAAGAGRAREGHLVDALASRGDEGRGTLRKAPGSREQASIRGSPNGATHPSDGVPSRESIAWRGEPGELKHLSTRRKGHQPRLRQ